MKAFTTLTAALAFAGQTSLAQATYPEHTTEGYADKVNNMITTECPSGVFTNNVEANLKCADVSWQAAYDVASHVSNYIKQNRGKSISHFWAGAAQGELLGCERAVSGIIDVRAKLDAKNGTQVSDYLTRSHNVAVGCINNIDNAENGIEAWVDTPAQNHVINLLNCQVNPEGCQRPSKALDL